MLTEEEIKEIETVCQSYPDNRAVTAEALVIVQKHRGWVSDETLESVAQYLNLPPVYVDSVATFYNLIFRRQVGEHVILICNSCSCWIMGYEKILSYLKKCTGCGLGQTSADGRFTLLTSPCLGACDHAPAMMIDGELFTNLTEEIIDKILEKMIDNIHETD